MIETRTKFVVAPADTRAADLGIVNIIHDEDTADLVAFATGQAVYIVTIIVEQKEAG